MKITDRIEPDGDNIFDFLAEVELRRIALIATIDFIKKIRDASCCNVCHCLSCDAEKLLREMGEA